MKRKFLFAWYQTPRGKLLQQIEAEYLKKSITVGCKQNILQIGGLGWENEFIDCTLYQKFTVLDSKGTAWHEAGLIEGKSYYLPIQTDSIDMVLMPHILEFDANRFQTMREIERVLKPEGEVIIINFNPWSIWLRYQYLWDKKMADSWRGHFIPRKRVIDWLKLLNFEVKKTYEFGLDTVKSKSGKPGMSNSSFFSTAYAIRAVKRRYHLIPLTPVRFRQAGLAIAKSMSLSNRLRRDE